MTTLLRCKHWEFSSHLTEYKRELLLIDVKNEAEKNWESVIKEVAEVGDRLADAVKAAWNVLTAPRPRS